MDLPLNLSDTCADDSGPWMRDERKDGVIVVVLCALWLCELTVLYVLSIRQEIIPYLESLNGFGFAQIIDVPCDLTVESDVIVDILVQPQTPPLANSDRKADKEQCNDMAPRKTTFTFTCPRGQIIPLFGQRYPTFVNNVQLMLCHNDSIPACCPSEEHDYYSTSDNMQLSNQEEKNRLSGPCERDMAVPPGRNLLENISQVFAAPLTEEKPAVAVDVKPVKVTSEEVNGIKSGGFEPEQVSDLSEPRSRRCCLERSDVNCIDIVPVSAEQEGCSSSSDDGWLDLADQ